MDKNQLIQILKEIEVGEIRIDEMMKNHTSFKIGGPADIMILPKDEDEILRAIKACRDNNIDFFIMGNGSNLLIKDGGIRGVVIKINDNFNDIKISGDKVYAKAGALLTALSRRAAENSLTGVEFANGIPGTIGGAVTMNAGAYGGEIKDIVTKVRVIDKSNNIIEYKNDDMNFGYRTSKVIEDDLVVLGMEIQLKDGNYNKIKEKMQELTKKRTSKQPLELPSGGSTFKRPKGYYAGKLIDDSNLRGFQYGGAKVSEKHCGFVVNIGGATCEDVLGIVKTVQKTVMDKFGVELETEIKVIGED